MRNKKIWIFLIILVILVLVLMNISLWASTKEEIYNGKYYKYVTINEDIEFEDNNYEWIKEKSYKIIKNYIEFENYLKKISSDNKEIYQLKDEVGKQFFEENSLVIVTVKTYAENMGAEIDGLELKSIDTQNEKIKINFKICTRQVGYIVPEYDFRVAVPINSKNINTAEVNISGRDLYDKISNVCKNVAIVLSLVMISYITIYLVYQKTQSKLKTAIFIVLALIICYIGYYIQQFYYYDSMMEDKPVIYLYPQEETEVEVKVAYPEKLTCSYPKYEDCWKVLAEPTGELTDLETGRSLYCLYYEGLKTIETSQNEGFVVKGEDTIQFLEEKLEILGLTEREANEFIIYWLPKLEDNEYNFIRFQTIEEINENMPLEITPTPDTVIRVMMEYKSLTEYMEVQEQILTTPTREGFSVVEWGGTEIK